MGRTNDRILAAIEIPTFAILLFVLVATGLR